MTQSVQEKPSPLAQPSWLESGRTLVVGVDGSARSNAAVDWASAEAEATGRPLTLLHVLDARGIPGPLHAPLTDDEIGWQILNRVEARLRRTAPRVTVCKELALGSADRRLVSRSADASGIVVGRRGHGTFLRMLVGSTSLSLAANARVPVTIVPDDWSPSAHSREPVVVGVDHRDLQAEAIRQAFGEARRRGVPLVAVHGREVQSQATAAFPPPSGDAGADPNSLATLERALVPWRQEFPDVDVSLIADQAHPLTVLLDQAGPTQLLVLGRHSDRRRGGFPFGSVTRAVLHYAEVPVMVVPPAP